MAALDHLMNVVNKATCPYRHTGNKPTNKVMDALCEAQLAMEAELAGASSVRPAQPNALEAVRIKQILRIVHEVLYQHIQLSFQEAEEVEHCMFKLIHDIIKPSAIDPKLNPRPDFDFEDLKKIDAAKAQLEDLLDHYGSQLDKFAFEVIKDTLARKGSLYDPQNEAEMKKSEADISKSVDDSTGGHMP